MNISKKNILKYCLYGLMAGIITVILDRVPGGHNQSFWFFGFASGSFGIWGICAVIIILKNESDKSLSGYMLSFMAMMCISYYVLEGILDSITSYEAIVIMQSSGIEYEGMNQGIPWLNFNWQALMMWLIISVFCAVWTYITIKVTDKKVLYYCMVSVPLVVVLLEGIRFAERLFLEHKGFIPFICNFLGFIGCSYFIYIKKYSCRILNK